ncbi:sugar 3,4-ketoisomerase [Cohnella xylanilytica]|uniref:sugar 3,4-ketoisomerase n=1 Tax=Cohnella xylanilytica TaxID=557555 RepID=UPI0028929E9E|nr:FdtA/QdtA family cupin domain-containing protein [Cohnella xylanilytica]
MIHSLLEASKYDQQARGTLVVLEEQETIPFQIKRVFYIYGVQNKEIRRGGHAHYKTRQALIAITGSCSISLMIGDKEYQVELNKPDRILLVEPDYWHEMYDFSEDCILLVLASEPYQSNDYIHDFKEYKSHYQDGD